MGERQEGRRLENHQPDDYQSEKKKYEQLCRGEGLKMVSVDTHQHLCFCDHIRKELETYNFLRFGRNKMFLCQIVYCRLLGDRVAYSVVTMTTVVTQSM